jgi:glutamyl/glutaminyl-tRNA synthetase
MRLWVRFPTTGEKALLASAAGLELVDSPASEQLLGDRPSIHELDMANGGGWLADVSKRKIDDVMVAVSDDALDPFASPQRRLANILGLYRFDGSPARLVEWAVAQSGLDDPMSRFNRQELEQFHRRWLANVDAQLLKLLTDLKRERALVDAALKTAPPLAQRAVRRQLEFVR